MRFLAIIPARGGSRCLPRKNVLPLAGVPLVARAILAARECPHIGDCVVSTEDAEGVALHAPEVWGPLRKSLPIVVTDAFRATFVLDQARELAARRSSTTETVLTFNMVSL